MLTETASEFDVRAIARVLWSRKWTITATAVLIGSLAMVRAFMTTPIYQSSVELTLEPPRAQGPDLSDRGLSDQEIETQRRLITSEQVAMRVKQRLALTEGPRALRGSVTTSVVTESRVVLLRVTDTDPRRAAELAQSFAEEYLSFRRDEVVGRVLDAVTAFETRQSAFLARLAEVDAEIAALEDANASQRAVLTIERNSLLEQLGSIQAGLNYLEAGEAIVLSSGVILGNAGVPSRPIEPQPVRSTVLGVVLGGLLGVGLALAIDRLDDRVKGELNLQHLIGDLPVVGAIPWFEEATNNELITLRDPSAPASEAFRSLRTKLRFLSESGTLVVCFTSAVEAEGKTTVSANFAVATAQAGYRTLLVDADLRRPRVHQLFGVPNDTGLSHVLTSQAKVGEAVLTPISGLSVVTAGPTPPNPSELLSSQQFSDFIEELVDLYDVIVLDAAPVLPVADGYEVAVVADATVCVAYAHHSRGRGVKGAIEGLHRVGARLSGFVLTGLEPGDSLYDYYYYGYHDEEPPSENGRFRSGQSSRSAGATGGSSRV